MHVPYACRHSGACCASGWPIPLERARVNAIGPVGEGRSWLLPVNGAPADVAGVLALSANGRCVFHRPGPNGCEIHAALGHAALPSACQHFPREVLVDPRGVFVTLSHYCPTAAELLFTHHGPVTIVRGPPALPSGAPEGLDAREVLPPLLTSGVLMDHDGYSAWEEHMVHVLTADDGCPAEVALATLEGHLRELQRWRPGAGSLRDAVDRLPASPACSPRSPEGPREVDRLTHLDAAADVWPARQIELVVRRHLAARAFASWMAYEAGGPDGVLRSLRLTLSLVRREMRAAATLAGRLTPAALKECIGEADLQVLHVADRTTLASRLASDRPGIC
jgi:hypothetical protein